MQKKALFIACFFIYTGCLAQQYPFVHYTPKDGLVNSRVRAVSQDSKGRMYFMTYGGLSIYDGTVFRNYTTQNGLAADLVNDVLELGPDSIWIACNTPSLNYLSHGKIGSVKTNDGFYPTINKFHRTREGRLYVAADEGLYTFEKNRFVHIPFTDKEGKDAGKFLIDILEWKDLLFVVMDRTMFRAASNFFVFDKTTGKKLAENGNNPIVGASINNNHEIYVIDSAGKINRLDTAALRRQQIRLVPANSQYKLSELVFYTYFDYDDNLWLFTHNRKIVKIAPSGQVKKFSMTNGLGSNYFSSIFKDREGTIWISLHGSGIAKLVNDNIEVYDHFANASIDNLYTDTDTDSVFFYSRSTGKIFVEHNGATTESKYTGYSPLPGVFIRPRGKLYLSDGKNFFTTSNPGQQLTIRQITAYKDTVQLGLGNIFSDPYGNLVACGSSYLTVIVDDKPVCYYPISSYVDQIAFDKKNRVWVASRGSELYVLTINPGDPSHYLQLLKNFGKDYPPLSARSITVDHLNNVWVGTRYEGLYRFEFDDDLNLRSHRRYTTREGLSDNFITHLINDNENNIWVSTASGVDKIHYTGNNINIENMTRGNNIYENILRTRVNKSGIAWSLTADGNLIRIGKRESLPAFTPSFFITGLKIGNAIVDNTASPASYSHKQNSFSISVAASTFYDERQVKYSYLLEGSGNSEWSEPSNNPTFNFINLNPGTYNLKIKASFPGGRYQDQQLDYFFVIHPPWWQTWWFRISALVLIIGVLGFATRAYYRRKLERQQQAAEKQQAVEKERTRIATDIHDDLGSGLSRIRYLGEMVKLKTSQQQNILPDIEKISAFSDEMVDKMNEIVWALNEKNDSLEAIISYTRSFAVEYLTNNELKCRVILPEEIPHYIIKGETRRNIFLSVKESLHNIVKHADATEVIISVAITKSLSIHIQDNGKGIDLQKTRPFSNGIMNIKKRMKDAGGNVDFKNEEGTTVILNIPLI